MPLQKTYGFERFAVPNHDIFLFAVSLFMSRDQFQFFNSLTAARFGYNTIKSPSHIPSSHPCAVNQL